MMKNPAVKMSLLMGITMSFVLSLIGNLSSGMFTVPGFLKSFCISFLISLIIGFIIPIKKISDVLCEKAGARPGTLKARIIAAAVSAIGYTPFMTFFMVCLAHSSAAAHGAKIPFWPMLLRSECISIAANFVLSFLITPVYSRLVFGDRKPIKEDR